MVFQVIPHPDYNQLYLENDIALLKLEQHADLSVYTPACLPNIGDDFVGKVSYLCLISSLSATNHQAPRTHLLLSSFVLLLSLSITLGLSLWPLPSLARSFILFLDWICLWLGFDCKRIFVLYTTGDHTDHNFGSIL